MANPKSQVKAMIRHLVRVQLSLVSFWLALRVGAAHGSSRHSKFQRGAAFRIGCLGCRIERKSAKSKNTNYASPILFSTKAVWPNRSLNRTLCGGPGLGFKSLAQTQPTAKCRLASTLAITVEIRSDLNVWKCKATRNPNLLPH